MVSFGCLVQGCEIFINPLFYCTKFREELEFKVHYGIPPWLSLLKKIISAYKKTQKKEKKFQKKKKREREKIEESSWPC